MLSVRIETRSRRIVKIVTFIKQIIKVFMKYAL